MTFTALEVDFLKRAALGRLATIQPDGTPQNSPVAVTYNEKLATIDIPGSEMAKSRKYRNIAFNERVALVVDDITAPDQLHPGGATPPGQVRCLEIRGTAAQAEDDGHPIIRVTPRRVISFGIDDRKTEPHQLVAHVRNVGVEQQVRQPLPLR